MKFKLDENFGTRARALFHETGLEIDTVRDEGLGGAADQKIYDTCSRDRRCLITLDLDFADVTRFPPERAGGIVVIRGPKNLTLTLLKRIIRLFSAMLLERSPERQLWVVEPDRIRIHQPEE